MLTRIKEVLGFVPRQVSVEEEQFRISNTLRDYPLNNGDILYAIILKTPLTREDIKALADSYEVYNSVYPDDNPPVSLHLDRIGLGSINTPFLRRVSLNYDGGIGARERWAEDIKALQEGTLEQRAYGLMPSVNAWSRKYQGVLGRVEMDLESLVYMRILRGTKTFNRLDNLPETTYSAIRSEFWDPGLFYERKIREYEEEVIPFLEPGQVIKPADMECTQTFLSPIVEDSLAFLGNRQLQSVSLI